MTSSGGSAEFPPPESVSIAREADIVVCQRRARAFAAALGLSVRAQWEVAIAASEATTNILKYAARGSVTLRAVLGPPPGLEMRAADEGPGIPDVSAALRDGCSRGIDMTAPDWVRARGGLGLGLGAIRRLMDSVVITRGAAGGTVLVARKHGGGERGGR